MDAEVRLRLVINLLLLIGMFVKIVLQLLIFIKKVMLLKIQRYN